MSYCTNCGKAVSDGIQFCTNCGTRQTSTPAPVAPVTPAASALPDPPIPQAAPQWQPVPQAPQPIASAKPRSALPFVLVVLAVLALIAAGLIGGMVYVGYRVKQKVTSVAKVVAEHAPTPGRDTPPVAPAPGNPAPGNADVSSMLEGLGHLLGGNNDDGDPVESISSADPVVPCTPGRYPSQANARIPLAPGTVITTAWGIKNGDVESRNTVDAVDSNSLAMTAKTQDYKDDNGTAWKPDPTTHVVCSSDYASANNYVTVTGKQPKIIHDVTRLRLSDKSFQEIRSTGKTYLVYYDLWTAGYDNHKPDHEGGTLARVEPLDVPYPMIVNDQRVTLPAIHLAGTFVTVGKDPRPKKDRPTHTEAEVYVIDDPIDPLVLLLKLKDPVLHDNKFRIEDTKIEYPVAHPVNLVEKQLAETKKAVTWGIYFDFNKDTIKPESAPVLKEIAQAMTNNPEWKLTVAGNTDNIGGDTYNLDLSKRRAAAVKQALVTQYHMAPDRLSTDGYGASHPIETNDTLEGRARNRRVELTRE